MQRFPRPDYRQLGRYETGRVSVDVELGDNTNLWGPHPAAMERMRAATPADLTNYPATYGDELRAAVGELHGLDPMCVTTGHGSDGLLDYSMRTASAEGGTVRYPAPTFSMIAPMAIMNGLKPSPVPWPTALDNPEKLFEGDPSVVYVCRPNNPTGEMAPRGWLGEVVELARARASEHPEWAPLLLVDEAYAEYSGDTIVPEAPSHPRLLVLRTLSKVYGLAGMRCGYGVSSPEIALEIDKARGPFAVSRIAVATAAAALADRGSWMKDVVRECGENRERLRAQLESRGLRPFPSRTNFLLFPVTGLSAQSYSDALIKEGVWVRPFRRVPGLPESLRVTVGPWPLMECFLNALDRVRAEFGATK